MNIIFLDVDGVLNSTKKLIEVYNLTGKPHSGINYPFDENCMINLKYLMEETNSNIVISSSWRKRNREKDRLLEELKKYDLEKRVIGYTKELDTKVNEIGEYILSFDKEINFIIIDDDKRLSASLSNLVITNSYFGLTREDVNTGIKLLRRKKDNMS